MGILPREDPCPCCPLLKRSQPWSSLCPLPVLFLPSSCIDHIPTNNPLKLGGRLWSAKPDSVPKINWGLDQEAKHLRGIRLDSFSNHRLVGHADRISQVKTAIGDDFLHSLPKGYLQGCSREYCRVSEGGYCLAQRGWLSTPSRATRFQLEIRLWCRKMLPRVEGMGTLHVPPGNLACWT